MHKPQTPQTATQEARSAFLRSIKADPRLAHSHQSITVDQSRQEIVFMKVESIVLRFADVNEVAQRGKRVLVVKTPEAEVLAEFQEEHKAREFCKVLIDAPLSDEVMSQSQQQNQEPEETKRSNTMGNSPKRRQSTIGHDNSCFQLAQQGLLEAVEEEQHFASPPTNVSLEKLFNFAFPTVGDQVLIHAVTGSAPCLASWRACKVLGDGSFGRVVLAENIETKEVMAVKVINKALIEANNQIRNTINQIFINVCSRNCRALVQCHYIYEDGGALYLFMEFMQGGEMFHLLSHSQYLSEEKVKFAGACWVLGIEALHEMGMIYHGGKTEDFLLTSDGYLKLADFGLCEYAATSKSLCGTPEYVSPEMIARKQHTKMVDFWTLGVLLFEMMVGIPPFYHKNRSEMLKMILHRQIDFNALSHMHKIPPQAQSFISSLLKKKPEERLGAQGFNQIKGHPWFADIDWELLAQAKLTSPFQVSVNHALDTQHFDPFFTSKEVPSVLRRPKLTSLSLKPKYLQVAHSLIKD